MTRLEPVAAARDQIIGTSLSLFLFLAFVRAGITGSQGGTLRTAARLLLSSYYDFAYAAGLTLLVLALLAVARRRPSGPRLVARASWTAAALSLLAALFNREIVPIFGKPFTYQWLYYSDFLQGQDAKNAVRWFLSVRLALSWAATLFAFLVTARVLAWLLGGTVRRARPSRVIAAGATTLGSYFLLGGAYFARAGSGWDRAQIANPIVAFAGSMVMAPQISSLLTLPTPVGPEDFTPVLPAAVPSPALAAQSGRTRNVILVVLETTPADQLDLFGAPYPVTPELTKDRPHAAIFGNIYAHCPATESSIVSLLLSLYPWLSYRSVTREYPALAIPSLSSELRRRDYRTAFFNSSDLRYARIGDFLAHRAFERLEGYRDIRCIGPELLDHNQPWETYLDGVDDTCTMDALRQWVGEPSPRPFFAMLWTINTHLPYFPPKPEVAFGVPNQSLNRYLNALRHDDAVIGTLLHFLEENRLAESTLVVVVGDHGESFGQHGHVSHGSKIYDEDVHVPLLLIQPGRFHGEKIDTIGGLIDVAPTILDILGLPPPPAWQGRSLFRGDRPERTYFFAPHSNYYLGFREGDLYYIDNVWQNRFEVYDMAMDPRQTRDLAKAMPDRVRLAKQRLAAWVQYQDRLYRGLFARPKRSGALAVGPTVSAPDLSP